MKTEYKKLLTNNAEKMWAFCLWYVENKNPKEFPNCLGAYSKEKVNKYLENEEVIAVIKEHTKVNKDLNMIRIYEKMLEKALEGDVNCANWVEKFSKSDFFGTKETSKLEEIVKGFNVGDD